MTYAKRVKPFNFLLSAPVNAIDRPPRKDVKKDFQFKNRIDAKVVIEDWRRM